MRREEHNGPDFHYKVLWRPVNDGDGDGDGDEESDATHPETNTDDDHDEDEDQEDDGWHVMIIDDWERVGG